jgi:hypothetical protein
VTLHGKASTAAEKAKAESLAKQVEGVREVRNLIQVVADSDAEAVSVLDADLEKRVEEALPPTRRSRAAASACSPSTRAPCC